MTIKKGRVLNRFVLAHNDPGRQFEADLPDVMAGLYAEAWKKGYGFSDIGSIVKSGQWIFIYRALAKKNVIGKTGRGIGKRLAKDHLPEAVLEKIDRTGVTIQQWSNAYGFASEEVLNVLCGGEGSELVRARVAADFFAGDRLVTYNKNLVVRSSDYLGGVYIYPYPDARDLYVAMPDKRQILSSTGVTYKEAIMSLMGKAGVAVKIERLYSVLKGELTEIDQILASGAEV